MVNMVCGPTLHAPDRAIARVNWRLHAHWAGIVAGEVSRSRAAGDACRYAAYFDGEIGS
jgi:hypothetical protein